MKASRSAMLKRVWTAGMLLALCFSASTRSILAGTPDQVAAPPPAESQPAASADPQQPASTDQPGEVKSRAVPQLRDPNRPPPILRPPTQLPPLVPNGAFACMADQGDPQGTTGRDLDGSIYSDAGMTNSMCRARCGSQGLRYAATQFSTYCFCGNSYGRFGPSTACTARCSGKLDEVCGGTWANSVSTALPPPPVAGTPPRRGGQCLLEVTQQTATTKYRHTEIQRWDVTGAAQPGPNGSWRYPVSWTTYGSGEKHVDQGTQQNDVVYSINATVNQTWVAAKNPLGTEWLLRREGAQGRVHGALLGTQWATISGVPQRPGEISAERWEFMNPPAGLKAAVAPTPVVFTNNATYTSISVGYQQPGGATSTVRCSWDFAL